MRRLAFALASLLSMTSYFPAMAQAPIQGTWQGQYICRGIPYVLTLVVSGTDQTNIGARATVRPAAGTFAAEFEMTGVVDFSGRFELRPTRQLNRVPGFRPAGYRGRLSPDSRNANVSVVFPGCGQFSLQRTAQEVGVAQQTPTHLAASRPPAPQTPITSAPVASAAAAPDGSADAICQTVSDNQSLAKCVWAIIRVNPDPTRRSIAGASAVRLVGYLIFKDVIQQYPVTCSEMSRELTFILDGIKRLSRGMPSYEPKTCNDIAGLVRAISTISPQWAGCPNTDYSMNQFETCVRTFLDRDVEPALRYMFSQLTDNPEIPVPALKSTLMPAKLDDALKAAVDSKAAQRRIIVSDAENCRKFNPNVALLSVSQGYGMLATGAMEASQNPSSRFAALQQRQQQVTCHDIIDLADGLEVAAAGTPPAIVAEKKCQHEAATIYEPGNKGEGVPWDRIDGPRAVNACQDAVTLAPDNVLLKLMLARALIVNKSAKDGFNILTAEATSENPVALMLVHDLFYYGLGVSLDKKTAAELAATAAKQGNGAAQSVLGFKFYYGDGVDKNLDAAVDWLNKAGDDRLPAMTTLLGTMYLEGVGVPRNDVRAVELFKTAQPHDCLAYYYLAVARENNRGGLSYHGEPPEKIALRGIYDNVSLNSACPDDVRRTASERAEAIISLKDVGTTPGRGGNDPLMEAIFQGAGTMKELLQFEIMGQKAGIIDDEMEREWAQAGKEFDSRWDARMNSLEQQERLKRSQDLNCVLSGYNFSLGGYCR